MMKQTNWPCGLLGKNKMNDKVNDWVSKFDVSLWGKFEDENICHSIYGSFSKLTF